MERMEIEARLEFQQALQMVQQLLQRMEQLQATMKATGKAGDEIGEKTAAAATKAGAALSGVAPATQKFRDELEASRKKLAEVEQKVKDKKKAVNEMEQSMQAATNSVQMFIQAWAGLAIVQRLLAAVDERLKGIVDSTLRLAGEQVQQAAMAAPVMEAFGLFPQGRAGETQAVRMVNQFAGKTGMTGSAASSFLSSMASSIGNDPRRIGELSTIAGLGMRSGISDRESFDLLKSIFTGTNGQLVPAAEIDRRAAAIQYGLLTSGKSDPRGFLTGLGKVVSQRTTSGGDWNKAFTDFLSLTSIMPAGQQASQQASMVMRALLGEEPEAREKLTAIYAASGNLPGFKAISDEELSARIRGGKDQASQSIRMIEESMARENDRARTRRIRFDEEKRKTPADIASFNDEIDRHRDRMRNLELDRQQKVEAMREDVNAQRRSAAFAALGPDQRIDVGLAAFAAASGNPVAMDQLNLALGGQQMRAEAVRRLASPAGMGLRAQHLKNIGSPEWMAQLRASEQGMAQTTGFRQNAVAAMNRQAMADGTSFGTQLFNEFNATVNSDYEVFKSTSSDYTRLAFIHKPVYNAARNQAADFSQTTLTEKGMRAAFASSKLIQSIRSTEMMYRASGNTQTADKIAALGRKYETLLFADVVGGGVTPTQIESTISSAFNELGGIIESAAGRGEEAGKAAGFRDSSMPLAPIPLMPGASNIQDLGPASASPTTQPASGANYSISVGQMFVAPGGAQDLDGRLEGITGP